MKLNFCCLIGLGADRSSLGRQGAEPVVPTEARTTDLGRLRAEGAEPVVPTEAPQQGPGRLRPLRKFDKGIGDR